MIDDLLDCPVPPDGLAPVVHGPVVLGRAPGIAVGLRCIFGYPQGLSLPMVLRARGVQAEAASRLTFPAPGRSLPEAGEPELGPLLTVEVDGAGQVLRPSSEESSGGGDAFDLEAAYWVAGLPSDGRLRLTVAWPRAGLPETGVLLTLPDLHDLDARVLSLP